MASMMPAPPPPAPINICTACLARVGKTEEQARAYGAIVRPSAIDGACRCSFGTVASLEEMHKQYGGRIENWSCMPPLPPTPSYPHPESSASDSEVKISYADLPRLPRLDIDIRECCGRDEAKVVEIAAQVRDDGNVWWWPPEMSDEALHKYWFGFEKDPWARQGRRIYIACLRSDPKEVLGAYLLEPNKPGNCSHVAHGAFLVKREYRRQGVARKMGEDSLDKARRLQYRSMQFNMVVSTNVAAVNLWKSLGFDIVGTLPGAFSLHGGEYCDGFVMFRNL
jgi:RimJ/RimL family protein N-acetyltransferase